MTKTALEFNAVQQFVVSPDRYYRVSVGKQGFTFEKTGSQFDVDHPGSTGRNRMTEEEPEPAGDETEDDGIDLSPGMMILVGLGIIVASILLMLGVAWVTNRIYFQFFFFVAAGIVLLMAGCVTLFYGPDGKHDFEIPIADVEHVQLTLPKAAGRVARLRIDRRDDKPVELTLNSETDLALVRDRLMPKLGKRGDVVDG